MILINLRFRKKRSIYQKWWMLFLLAKNVYHLLYCAYQILCPSFVVGRYLTKRVFFSTTQNGDLLVCTDLLNVAADDDIAEFLVQFDGAADAVGLLTGNQRRAGPAEVVKHHGVCHRAVLNRIGQKRNGFHGRVVAVLLELVELPDGGLFPTLPS